MKATDRGLLNVVAISEFIESVDAGERADLYDMGLLDYDGSCSDLLWVKVEAMSDVEAVAWLNGLVRRGL